MPDLMCFGLDIERDTYEELSSWHPLIFRIHQDSPTQGLVAKAFRNSDRSTIPKIPTTVDEASIAKHIGKWTPKDSPWLSCTLSWPYVVWEINRRKNEFRIPGEFYVSIIDSSYPTLGGLAALPAKLMCRLTEDRYQKALNFSRAFQEVLIYGEIPCEAILVTVPWKTIERTFRCTHIGALSIPGDLEQPFSRYCDKLRDTYHSITTQTVQRYAIDQAMEVLGSELYPKVKSPADLAESTNHVYHFSRSLFAWPYRHPSYKALPLPSVNSVADERFPAMKEDLLAAIKEHEYCRRATIEFHLRSTEAEIASYRRANDLRQPETRNPDTQRCIDPSESSAITSLKSTLMATLQAIESLGETSAAGFQRELSQKLQKVMLSDVR